MTTTPERRAEVEELLREACTWISERTDGVALALVGSWARNAARMDSDVDLVLLTDNPAAYVEGAITERRIRLPTGLEVGSLPRCRPAW